MFKPLLRTLPSLSGNIKLACEINDFKYEESNVYSTYIRSASLQPLQNNLYNRRINVNLLNGMWEHDVAKFYKHYSNYFYKTNHTFLYDDFMKLDLLSYNASNDSRNKDYEFGCKHISFNNTGYMLDFYAPIYVSNVEDLPEYFLIRFDFENGEHKEMKVNISEESTLNYLKIYLEKYIHKINRNVAYFISNTGRMIYYGIDVNNGGLVDIEDTHMSKYFKKNTTINNFDSELCAGFMNNKLIMRQIIPLSYHFNVHDIFSSFDKKYFIGHRMKVTGHYYKNGIKCKFYDFDINYTNKYVIDAEYDKNSKVPVPIRRSVNNAYYNIVDNESIFSLHEKYIKQYYYTNAITPMYTSWKMLLSTDACPYISNLNYVYTNSSNNIYGQFPKMFVKYDYEKYATLNGNDLELNKNEKLFNNLQNTYMSNWYTLLDKYEKVDYDDILNQMKYWFKVENNYAYYKGILYNFANCEHLNDIDYFAVFIRPSVEIIQTDYTSLYDMIILSDVKISAFTEQNYGDVCINEQIETVAEIDPKIYEHNDFDKKSIITDIYDLDNNYEYSNHKILANANSAKPKVISENIITGKYTEDHLLNDNDILDKEIYTTLETTNSKKNVYVSFIELFNEENVKSYILNHLKDGLTADIATEIFAYMFEHIILGANKGESNSFIYLVWRFTQLMLKKTSLYTSKTINNSSTYRGGLLNPDKDIMFSNGRQNVSLVGNAHKWNIFVDTNGQVYEANTYISYNTFNETINYIYTNARQFIDNSTVEMKNNEYLKRLYNLSKYENGFESFVTYCVEWCFEVLHEISNECTKYEFIFDNIILRNDMSLNDFYSEIINISSLRNNNDEDSENTISTIINSKWPFTSIDVLLAHINNNNHENVHNQNSLLNIHFAKNGYVEKIETLSNDNPLSTTVSTDNIYGNMNYSKPLYIDAAYINNVEKYKNNENAYDYYYRYLKEVYGDAYSFFGPDINIFDNIRKYTNIESHIDKVIPDFDKTYNVGNYSQNIHKVKGPQYFFNTYLRSLQDELSNGNVNSLVKYVKYHTDTINDFDLHYTMIPKLSSRAIKPSTVPYYCNVNVFNYAKTIETNQKYSGVAFDYVIDKYNCTKLCGFNDNIVPPILNDRLALPVLITDYKKHSSNALFTKFDYDSIYDYLATNLSKELARIFPKMDFKSSLDVNTYFYTVLNRIICKDNLDRLKFEIKIGAPITFKSDTINLKKVNLLKGICQNQYDFISKYNGLYDDDITSHFYKYNMNDNSICNILTTHAMSESKNIDETKSANPTYFSYPLLYDNVMKLFVKEGQNNKQEDEVYLFNGSPFLILPNILPFENDNNGISIKYSSESQKVNFGLIPFINEGCYNDDIYAYARLMAFNDDVGVTKSDELFIRFATIASEETDKKIAQKWFSAIKGNTTLSDIQSYLFPNSSAGRNEEQNVFINPVNCNGESVSIWQYVMNKLIKRPEFMRMFNVIEKGDIRTQILKELNIDNSDIVNKFILENYNKKSIFGIYGNFDYIVNSGLYNKLYFISSIYDNIFKNVPDNNFKSNNADTIITSNLLYSIPTDILNGYVRKLYNTKSKSDLLHTIDILKALRNKNEYQHISQYNDIYSKTINVLFDDICALHDDVKLQSAYDKYSPTTYNSANKSLFMFSDLGFNDIDNNMFISYSHTENSLLSFKNKTSIKKFINQIPLYVFPNTFVCSEFATLHDISDYYSRKKFEDDAVKAYNEYNNSYGLATITQNKFRDFSASNKVYDDNLRIALVSTLKNSYLHNMRNFSEVMKYYKENDTTINIKNIKEHTLKTIESLAKQSYCFDKTWKTFFDELYDAIATNVEQLVERHKNMATYKTLLINTETGRKVMIKHIFDIRKELAMSPEISYLNYVMQQLMIMSTSYNQINEHTLYKYLSDYLETLQEILDNREVFETDTYYSIDSLYETNSISPFRNPKFHEIKNKLLHTIKSNRLKTLYYNGNVSVNYCNNAASNSKFASNLNFLCTLNEYTNKYKKQYSLFYGDKDIQRNDNTGLTSRTDSDYNAYHYSIIDNNKKYVMHYLPSEFSYENTFASLDTLDENRVQYLLASDVFVNSDNLDQVLQGNTLLTANALFNIVGLENTYAYNGTIIDSISIKKEISINTESNSIRTLIYDILLPLVSSMNIYRKLLETIKLYKIDPKSIDTENFDNNDSLTFTTVYDGSYISKCLSTETEETLNNPQILNEIPSEFITQDKKYSFKKVVEYIVKMRLANTKTSNESKDQEQIAITDTNYFKYIDNEVIERICSQYDAYIDDNHHIKNSLFPSFDMNLYSKKELLPLDTYFMSNMLSGKKDYQYYIYELCNDNDMQSSNLTIIDPDGNVSSNTMESNIAKYFGKNVSSNMIELGNHDDRVIYVKPFSFTEKSIYKNSSDKAQLKSMLNNYIKEVPFSIDTIYGKIMNEYNTATSSNLKVYVYNKHNSIFGVLLNSKTDAQHNTLKSIISNHLYASISNELSDTYSLDALCKVLSKFIYLILYRYDVNNDKIDMHKELLYSNTSESFSYLIMRITETLNAIMDDLFEDGSMNTHVNLYANLYGEHSNGQYDDIKNLCNSLQKEIEKWYSYWYYDIAADNASTPQIEFDITFENIILIDKKRTITNIYDDLRKLYEKIHLNTSDENAVFNLLGYATKNICYNLPYRKAIYDIIDMLISCFKNNNDMKDAIDSYCNTIVTTIFDNFSDEDTKALNRHLLIEYANYAITNQGMGLYFYIMNNNIEFNELDIESDNITHTVDNIDNNLKILIKHNNDGTKTTFAYYCIDANVTNSSIHYHISESYDNETTHTFDKINGTDFSDLDNAQSVFIKDYFNVLYPLLKNDIFISFLQNSKLLQKPYQFQQKIVISSQSKNMKDYLTYYRESNDKSRFIKKLNKSYSISKSNGTTNTQAITLNRYLNYIEPYIKETDTIYDCKSKMFKTNNIIFNNQNLYTEDISIKKYNPLIVFDKLENYNTISLVNDNMSNSDEKYEIAPMQMYQYEYKHFNDNNLFILENEFEHDSTKLYTYDELLKAESNDVVYKLFRNYIQKRHNNVALKENEILFLFNKYNVTFKSNFVKFDMTLTHKLYTLKYIFKLK